MFIYARISLSASEKLYLEADKVPDQTQCYLISAYTEGINTININNIQMRPDSLAKHSKRVLWFKWYQFTV